MSNSPSVASRPTESELDLELAELVNWQRFATHLPDLTRGDIQQIEQDNHDTSRQKLELFGMWLCRCPTASWKDVITALEKAKENVLADIIKKKFNVVKSSTDVTHDTDAPNQVPSSSQEVYLSSEESVVEELTIFHRSFTSLAKDIRCKLEELVKSGKVSLHDIAAYIEEAQVCGIKGLTKLNTIDELFEAIRPHNDYLDCELLEMIVQEYLHDDDITHQVKAHNDKVKHFKCTAPIKTLKNKLHQYTSIPNISDMHLIVTIKLQEDWGRVALAAIEKLVRNLLQYRHEVRILKVEPGSISVMLLLPKEKLQHFIDASRKKLQFMRLMGIFRLQIGDTTVLQESENKNFTFDSALLESSQSGNNEAVQFLVDEDNNVNCVNSEGKTALILASEAGHEEVVRTLVSAGASVNLQDNNGHTALMVSKTKEIFSLLLQYNEEDINTFTHEGSMPLMIASKLGCLSVVETLLIEHNNDPNVQNKIGWTALMFASRNGHFQVAKLLLEHNADPNVHDTNGLTAAMIANQNGHSQVEQLLTNSQKASPEAQKLSPKLAGMFQELRDAIMKDKLDKVISCLPSPGEECAEVLREVDSEGKTLLHLAVWYGGRKITMELLSAATAVQDLEEEMKWKKDKNGVTPVLLAVKSCLRKQNTMLFSLFFSDTQSNTRPSSPIPRNNQELLIEAMVGIKDNEQVAMNMVRIILKVIQLNSIVVLMIYLISPFLIPLLRIQYHSLFLVILGLVKVP